MNQRQRRREAHGIVALLIQSYLDRDFSDEVDVLADEAEIEAQNKELERIRDYHYARDDREPGPKTVLDPQFYGETPALNQTKVVHFGTYAEAQGAYDRGEIGLATLDACHRFFANAWDTSKGADFEEKP